MRALPHLCAVKAVCVCMHVRPCTRKGSAISTASAFMGGYEDCMQLVTSHTVKDCMQLLTDFTRTY